MIACDLQNTSRSQPDAEFSPPAVILNDPAYFRDVFPFMICGSLFDILRFNSAPRNQIPDPERAGVFFAWLLTDATRRPIIIATGRTSCFFSNSGRLAFLHARREPAGYSLGSDHLRGNGRWRPIAALVVVPRAAWGSFGRIESGRMLSGALGHRCALRWRVRLEGFGSWRSFPRSPLARFAELCGVSILDEGPRSRRCSRSLPSAAADWADAAAGRACACSRVPDRLLLARSAARLNPSPRHESFAVR